MPKAMRSGTRTPTRSGGFAASMEALRADAARFAGSDPAALSAVAMLDDAADLVDTVVEALDRVGTTAATQVGWDPRVVGQIEGLAEYVAKAAPATRETAAAVKRAMAGRITELETMPKWGAWDHSRNR